MHDHILGGRQVTSELMAVSFLGSVLSELVTYSGVIVNLSKGNLIVSFWLDLHVGALIK